MQWISLGKHEENSWKNSAFIEHAQSLGTMFSEYKICRSKISVLTLLKVEMI